LFFRLGPGNGEVDRSALLLSRSIARLARERRDGAVNEVEPNGHGCVVVVTASRNAIDSVVFRFTSIPIVFIGFPIVFTGFPIVLTSFPIVLTGFVILLAGSVILIGRRLFHSTR
jgi:hypothetical protein